MGLPVILQNHVNQRSIVKEGIFIRMTIPVALTQLCVTPTGQCSPRADIAA